MKKKNDQGKDKREKKQAAYIFTTPKITKTNHRTGYHKPIKNPTTNFAPDSHKEFCQRCEAHNHGCQLSGAARRACAV